MKMRSFAAGLLAAGALLTAVGPTHSQTPAAQTGPILVYTKTAGFAHQSIPVGLDAIKKLGAQNSFTVDTTADPAFFTPANLAKYKAIVFLSTTGDMLPDPAQRAALEGYIRGGGGYFGIHAASDMGSLRTSWPWYRDLVGASFKGHTSSRVWSDTPLPDSVARGSVSYAGKFADAAPDAEDVAGQPWKAQTWEPARMIIEDQTSPMTMGWDKSVTRSDEWYGFTDNPRAKVHVIASLDETSYKPVGGAMNGDHPITWCQSYSGGRSVYTGLGHVKGAWSDPQMLGHILGGIRMAAGSAPFNCAPAKS